MLLLVVFSPGPLVTALPLAPPLPLPPVQRAFFPLQLISKAERQLDAKQGSPQASKSEKESRRMRKVLEKVRRG